jgi:hypothetical protein
MALFALPVILMLGLLALAAVVFYVWMLVDCLMNEPSEGNDKLVWAMVILFANGLGAIIYFMARRPSRIEKYGH